MQVTLEVNSGFAFFNFGHDSGFSQPHKHIQLQPRWNFYNDLVYNGEDKVGKNQTGRFLSSLVSFCGGLLRWI